MRLLMVAESNTHTNRWAHYFQSQGNDVLVVSPSDYASEGVHVVQFPPPRAWWRKLPRERFGGGIQRWLAGWPDWRRLLSQFDPHIIHVHYVSAETRNYFYYRGVSHLIVSTYGSDVIFDPSRPPSYKNARRIRSLLKQADIVTATTHFLATETRKFLTPDKRTYVVPFGVDCEKFKPGPPKPTHLSQPITLGFVKHLTPKYGPDLLLEAFAIVQRQRPYTRLVMAGSGLLELSLRRQACALGLSDYVDFVGRVPNEYVPNLMRQFDIFVMPSVCNESFGVAAIEASACGLPVVASRVGGVPEAVIHGKTGILVAPGDPMSLAQACIELVDRFDMRQAMGEAGRDFVLTHFRVEDTGARMETIYNSLLQV